MYKNITVYVKEVNDPPICNNQGKLKLKGNFSQQNSSCKYTDWELQNQWVIISVSTVQLGFSLAGHDGCTSSLMLSVVVQSETLTQHFIKINFFFSLLRKRMDVKHIVEMHILVSV